MISFLSNLSSADVHSFRNGRLGLTKRVDCQEWMGQPPRFVSIWRSPRACTLSTGCSYAFSYRLSASGEPTTLRNTHDQPIKKSSKMKLHLDHPLPLNPPPLPLLPVTAIHIPHRDALMANTHGQLQHQLGERQHIQTINLTVYISTCRLQRDRPRDSYLSSHPQHPPTYPPTTPTSTHPPTHTH
jgi:hypothetical protein